MTDKIAYAIIRHRRNRKGWIEMEEIELQLKKILVGDYFNENFEKNVNDLLILTNRSYGKFDSRTIKRIIITYNMFVDTKSVADLYMCKDAVIKLYNELIESEK